MQQELTYEEKSDMETYQNAQICYERGDMREDFVEDFQEVFLEVRVNIF